MEDQDHIASIVANELKPVVTHEVMSDGTVRIDLKNVAKLIHEERKAHNIALFAMESRDLDPLPAIIEPVADATASEDETHSKKRHR